MKKINSSALNDKLIAKLYNDLHATNELDLKSISPTAFSNLFESALNSEMRKQKGMHFTNKQTIHKVIDPLFLDGLKAELQEIKKMTGASLQRKRARQFQNKLATLKFLDPSCGGGNFLVEIFIYLRKLENEALEIIYKDSSAKQLTAKDIRQGIKVSVKQFYGIEIDKSACSVTRLSLWIAENKMLQETQELLTGYNASLSVPLKPNHNIYNGNALRLDWNEILKNSACDFIVGNPPFVGAQKLNSSQKEDRKAILGKISKFGMLDYVACWYYKAKEYIKNTKIKVAFVSTDSITEGTQVPILWKNMLNDGLVINFAYRTFVWTNDTKNNATVFCVIISFSYVNSVPKFIFDNDKATAVSSISPYLIEGKNILITAHSKPISKDMPKMLRGNTPTDGGGLLFDAKEYEKIKRHDPIALKYVKQYMMGQEFLHNTKRYCFWLTNAKPTDLHQSSYLRKHLKIVKDFRSHSKSKSAQRMAEYPELFLARIKTGKSFIALPKVSAMRRDYIPIGFLTDKVIPGDKLFVIPNADLFVFGLLNSRVHMEWIKTISGKYGPSYSYSNTVVYNNFPFPKATKKQKNRIEQTAQAILNARTKYSDACLVELYDPLTMPVELRKAHKANNEAVMQAYGFGRDANENEIVAKLFKMYEELTSI